MYIHTSFPEEKAVYIMFSIVHVMNQQRLRRPIVYIYILFLLLAKRTQGSILSNDHQPTLLVLKAHVSIASRWAKKYEGKQVVPYEIEKLIVFYLKIPYKDIIAANKTKIPIESPLPAYSASYVSTSSLSSKRLFAYDGKLYVFTQYDILELDIISGVYNRTLYPIVCDHFPFEYLISSSNTVLCVSSKAIVQIAPMTDKSGEVWQKVEVIPSTMKVQPIIVDDDGEFIIGLYYDRSKRQMVMFEKTHTGFDSEYTPLCALPLFGYVQKNSLGLNKHNMIYWIERLIPSQSNRIRFLDIARRTHGNLHGVQQQNYYTLAILDEWLVASFLGIDTKYCLQLFRLSKNGKKVDKTITIPTKHRCQIEGLMAYKIYLLTCSKDKAYVWKMDDMQLVCYKEVTQEVRKGRETKFFTASGLLFLFLNGYFLNLGKIV